MSPRHARWWRAAALAGPVLAAAALAAWGIGFGLPFDFRPDEELLVGRSVQMAVAHSLDPLFYVYPPLGIDLFAAAEWLLGVAAPAHLGPATRVDPGLEYLAARSVSAFAFAAATGLLGLAGRAAYGRLGGLVAATAFAVAPLAVQNAHFARVDLSATAFLALALWLGGRAGDRRGWAVAGAAAGLAAATKYTFGVVAVYLLVLVLTDAADRRARTVAVIGGALAAFLLALLPAGQPAQFGEGLRFLGGRSLGGYGGLAVGFLYHPSVSLPAGLGAGAYLLSLAGIAVALGQRSRADLALLAFLAASYLATGFSHEVFIRYTLLLLPALCLLAGGAVRLAGESRSRAIVAAAIAAVLLVPSLAASVVSDRLLDVTDTRVLAARWLEANAPAGSEVRIDSYWAQPFYDAQELPARPLHPLYLTGREIPDSFQLGLYTTRFAVNRPGTPCYRLSESAAPYQAPPPEVAGQVVARFLPYGGTPPVAAVYDPLDSFYLPLEGFGTLQRPGPSIVISEGC